MKKIGINSPNSGNYAALMKGLFVMKIVLILILTSTFNLLATGTYSQTTRMSLSLNQTSIKQALKEIERSSEFYFLYNNELIDVERKVDIQVDNELVSSILDMLFDSKVTKYAIYDKQIVISPAGMPLPQEAQRKVSGKVTDQSGAGIPGATVAVKGLSVGIVTDSEGRFNLSIPADAKTLVFSFVGMNTQEITIGVLTQINVTMAESAIGLEEVVIVGYGTQKKVDLTGAIDVITNEKLTNRQASTTSQLLQGLTPGANFAISGKDGFQPGATMDITIRGIGSLNGGKPYILIDGFPGDINVLNPNDIESISVLKDAASSAIYGARAAYGVILVTTKKGNKNEKLIVNYTGNVFVKTPPKLPKSLDSYTWARLINDAGNNRGGTNYLPEQLNRILAYQNKDWETLRQLIPNWPEGATNFGTFPKGNLWDNANLNYANTDWWDVFYGHSVNQKHDISIQGGSKNASYYFSAGYLNEKGVLNYGTDIFQRINIMGKIDLAIADWWDFNWETRLSNQNRKYPNNLDLGYSNMFNEIARAYPITPIYDGWGHVFYESHIPLIESGTNNIIQNDYWNNFKMEIRPVKGWKINADFGYNSTSIVNTSIKNLITVYDVNNNPYVNGVSIPNKLQRIHQNNNYWNSNIYTSYNLGINDLHNFLILVGMQFEHGNNSQLLGSKTDLIVESVPSLQTAIGTSILSESLSHRATEGYFSRFSYNYKEKYLFETNLRYDGSYVFRESKRWGFFPSLSLGWNVNKETFWDNIEKYINTLKFRLSWGQLGNQDISPYSDLELVPIQTDKLNWIFNYGETRPIGYTLAPSLVNKYLTWETATTKNLGLNMSFLNRKLTADLDLYERLTTDMVGPSEATPGVLGASVPKANNSSLRTRGWELALNWKQDLKNGFSYFINLNLYNYKSVVMKYYNPTGTLSTWYEGAEVGSIWGYKVNDLFRSQEELDNYRSTVDLSYFSTRWMTGDVKYEDTNNDGKVNNGTNTIDNHGDLSIIGNSEPRYQYGITAGMNFKGFDFSMLWRGIAKEDVYFNRSANLFWGFGDARHNGCLTTNILDYFRDAPGTVTSGLYEGDANINTSAYWPRPYLNSSENAKNKDYPNTRYLQHASYLRLQNVKMGYSLPKRIVSKLNLQMLNVYFSGENLITFNKLPAGIDPVALTGTEGVVGKLTYGADRIYSLGISITY